MSQAAPNAIFDKALEALISASLISWICSATYHTTSEVGINAAIRTFIKYHNLEDSNYTIDGLRRLYRRKKLKHIGDIRKNAATVIDNDHDDELLTRMKSIERKIDQIKPITPDREFPQS